MRILAIEDWPTTERGGSERSYFDTLTGLQDQGHHVVLIYEKPGDLLDKYYRRGVAVVQCRLPLLIRKGDRWADFKDLLRASRIASQHGPFDVIYINYTHALPLAALIKLRSGSAIVCHIRLAYHGLTRQILWSGRLATTFIVINNKMKPVFERVFKAMNKVNVVYNGVDIPDNLPTPKVYNPGTEIRMLYLGRLAPEKGIVQMVGAFANAIRKGLNATLQITGSYAASDPNNYQAELVKSIRESALGDLIRVNPSIPNPIEYISNFDLLIFPSTWDEPFGRTIPEAILAGTPVLTRNVGMINEIMIDNPDFLFDSDGMLTKKMMEFYGGQIKFNLEAARATIRQRFDKRHMINGVERIIQAAIKKES